MQARVVACYLLSAIQGLFGYPVFPKPLYHNSNITRDHVCCACDEGIGTPGICGKGVMVEDLSQVIVATLTDIIRLIGTHK